MLRPPRKRIGQEPLRRQSGTVQIAPRNPSPAYVKLTRYPNRNWRTMPIQNVYLLFGNRRPMGKLRSENLRVASNG